MGRDYITSPSPELVDLSSQNNETIFVISPAEEYLIYHVLKQKESIVNGIGSPDTFLTGCLVLVFVILFISMVKGTESTGKVAYFNAILPFNMTYSDLNLRNYVVSFSQNVENREHVSEPDSHWTSRAEAQAI